MKNNLLRIISLFLILIVLSPHLVLSAEYKSDLLINKLKFDDFVHISKIKKYKASIVKKLLSTPIVNNSINPKPSFVYKKHESIGRFIRVAQWDIKFNMSPKAIEDAFLAPENLLKSAKEAFEEDSTFITRNLSKKQKKNHIPKTLKKTQKEIMEESKSLKNSDIIIFNNIDIGMPRTKYKNMPDDLAKKLGYNYAFVPEFIEVDPATLGIKKHKWSEEMVLKEYGEIKEYSVNKNKYKGLTGTAILSKFPLENVRIIKLKDVYDWYYQEKGQEPPIEDAMRKVAKTVFKEEVIRRVRVGGRKALLADIKLPEETITIVATQIERRTRPNERAEQIKELLQKIKNIKNPLILAGNLNTSTYNHTPKTFKRMLKDKLTDPDSVLELVASPFIAPIVGVAWLFRPIVDATRKASDPTVRSIPIISPNRERKMFNAIRKFRFEDKYAFDLRGNPDSSFTGSKKCLSSSNQRALKGFVATYTTKRNLGISNFKLSWIIAKGYNKKPKQRKNTIEKMAPHFGRTLYSLNYEYKYPLAMQAPITADFPLTNYTDKLNKETKQNL